MKLILQGQHRNMECWNTTIMRMLEKSGMFDIEWKDLPMAPRISGNRRGANFNLMILDGIQLALDTWDDGNPTNLYYNQGCFARDACFGDTRLILKIQYRPAGHWEAITKTLGIPVVGWTCFTSRVFPQEFFKWESKQHKYLVSTTGRNNRFGRTSWVEHCKKRGDCYVPEQHLNHKDDMEVYKDVLTNTRWGLSLKGLPRSDGKNRREAEFGSCGMPLVLNYQPTYPFEYLAGKQYVYMTKPEELDNLKDINPEPYSQAITQVWNDHFSATGMAKTLIELVKKYT